MSKTIQVSSNGTDFYTLPGNQGELTRDGATIDDTIFGQTYKSNMTGIITWGMNANAVYKGFAGYQAKILRAGTSTAMTAEPCTFVSGKTYRITNAARRIINRAVALTVFDNGVPSNTQVQHIDYLFGRITFKTSYTVNGPVTVTGAFFPTINVGKARSYTLTQTADPIDTTDFGTASTNGGFKTHSPGLRTVTLELPSVFDAADNWHQLLVSRDEFIIEVNPDGVNRSRCRGFFRLLGDRQAGNVGALEEETLNFGLSVPIEDTNPTIEFPFSWEHDASSTIPMGVRLCLDAWLGETNLHAQYLWDGTNGFKGEGVVSNFTMSGTMDGMNTFQFNWMGSNAPVSVP